MVFITSGTQKCFVHQKMFDYADEIVAALVLCMAAGYSS
jgi:hypothetical protein